MNENQTSPPRLFVYLAREAPVAAVLRRGPSDWARLSLWHTDSDIIEHGQWMKGRVYERRCDLSPDGSLFAAFVRQSGRMGAAQANRDTWIAVSKPPFFQALALWFMGGTYCTGAYFPTGTTIWSGYVDDPPDIGVLPKWLRRLPPREVPYVDGTSNWTDRTVHFNRLLRDGWTMLEREPYSSRWERTCPGSDAVLTMDERFSSFDEFGGPYVVEFNVTAAADAAVVPLGQANWADWDQQGRLVLAKEGRLFSCDLSGAVREIADFTGQTPDPQPAPSGASVWPKR